MNPTIPIVGASIAIVAGTIYLARTILRAAARRIETLIADALEHDWLTDLDDEYRTLTETDA